MRVKNNYRQPLHLSADQLQDLTLILLHQAKSPLVATGGFIEMIDLDGKTQPSVNQKLMRYAENSTQRALKLIDTIETVINLNTPTQELKIAPVRLDKIVAKTFGDQAPSGAKGPRYHLSRTYKLPLVLADQARLEAAFSQLAKIFSRFTRTTDSVEMAFRVRGDYEVVRFLAPSLDAVLTATKPVFLKHINLPCLAATGDSELIVQSYIIRRQIELMGGFIKVEAKSGQPTALYVHLPLARQLQLSLLSAGAKIE